MRLGLHVIANIFNWTDNDIQLNELLTYSKNIIKSNNDAIVNSSRFLSHHSTASAVMRHFVILIHEAHPYLITNTPFVIANTKSQISHTNFEEMARYWARIKNHLDDTTFRTAFENSIYTYHIKELT